MGGSLDRHQVEENEEILICRAGGDVKQDPAASEAEVEATLRRGF